MKFIARDSTVENSHGYQSPDRQELEKVAEVSLRTVAAFECLTEQLAIAHRRIDELCKQWNEWQDKTWNNMTDDERIRYLREMFS